MGGTMSMTRNQNDDDDDASTSRERPKRWSDIDHDLLGLVMMRLGVVDYYSFRGVCKSWRSLGCSNENKFMSSMAPMAISICCRARAQDKTCFLEDFEGRRFKSMLPQYSAEVAACVGLTCGYLIFFVKKTRSFWLVNPITRKELHFPNSPFDYDPGNPATLAAGRVILVFSPSSIYYGCGFVLLVCCSKEIWFSTEGKGGAWNHVSSEPFSISDIYAFKGKIYALSCYKTPYPLFELRLRPRPKLTMLRIKKPDYLFYPSVFVSSGERLCAMRSISEDVDGLHEVDLGDMKWVPLTIEEEYAFFYSYLNNGFAAVKRSLGRFPETNNHGRISFFTAKMWYFPHQSMDVDRIDH